MNQIIFEKIDTKIKLKKCKVPPTNYKGIPQTVQTYLHVYAHIFTTAKSYPMHDSSLGRRKIALKHTIMDK